MGMISAKVGAFCGVAAVVVFSSLYSVAMYLDTEYVFGEDYLSDLGVRDGAWAFNAGVMSAGVLIASFALFGLRPVLGNNIESRAGVLVLAMSGGFLFCVGVFTEDFDPGHLIVSVSFFLSVLVALGLLTMAFYRTKALGRFGWMLSLGAFILGVGLLFGGGTPLVETIAVLSAMVWGLFISASLLVRDPARPTT